MEPLVRTPRALAELTDDVDVSGAAQYSVLMWDGSDWVDQYPIWAISGGLGMNPWDDVTNFHLIQWEPFEAKFTDSGIDARDWVKWTDAGNIDFLTTGTVKAGGADAADVPITCKAHASQS